MHELVAALDKAMDAEIPAMIPVPRKGSQALQVVEANLDNIHITTSPEMQQWPIGQHVAHVQENPEMHQIDSETDANHID